MSSLLFQNAPLPWFLMPLPASAPRRKKGRDTSLIQRACKLNIYNSSASSVKEIEHISLNQRLLIGCFNISRRITEGKEDVAHDWLNKTKRRKAVLFNIYSTVNEKIALSLRQAAIGASAVVWRGVFISFSAGYSWIVHDVYIALFSVLLSTDLIV